MFKLYLCISGKLIVWHLDLVKNIEDTLVWVNQTSYSLRQFWQVKKLLRFGVEDVVQNVTTVKIKSR